MKDEESATLAQYIREKAELYRCSFNDLQWIVLYFKAHAPQFRCKCNLYNICNPIQTKGLIQSIFYN